jgi:hypothetical protein
MGRKEISDKKRARIWAHLRNEDHLTDEDIRKAQCAGIKLMRLYRHRAIPESPKRPPLKQWIQAMYDRRRIKLQKKRAAKKLKKARQTCEASSELFDISKWSMEMQILEDIPLSFDVMYTPPGRKKMSEFSLAEWSVDMEIAGRAYNFDYPKEDTCSPQNETDDDDDPPF